MRQSREIKTCIDCACEHRRAQSDRCAPCGTKHRAEVAKAREKARYWANPDISREYSRNYRKEKPEAVRQTQAAWRKQHLEVVRARSARWRNANKEQAYAIVKACNARNPEKKVAREHRRRARLKNLASVGVAPQDWADRVKLFAGCCAYCDQPAVERDHVIPISRGGLDDIFNVVPACVTCNRSKGAKMPLEWAGVL